ncbi:MAG: type II secretion system protein [Luteolibacter sp.]|jgi:hypothetical protein
MIVPPSTCRRPRGFMLLEVLLALGIFSAAAVGFVVAIHRMADAADMAQREMRITRILESAMQEAISIPVMEEGVTTVNVIENGMEIDTRIEPIEDLENKDGQLLQEMFRIEITANWFESGEWRKRSIETLRYGRMYQP